MVRARKDGRVALIVAAHLRTAVAARIQEYVHLARAVAAQNDRFLAHARDDEIAGVRNLAFMANEEPGVREDPLQFLLVDRLVDKDLAADLTGLQIDQTRPLTVAICC